jgi:methionyl-tRNA formyltransferase
MKSNKQILFIGESPMLLNCIIFANNFFTKIKVVTKDYDIKKKIPKNIEVFSNIKKVKLTKIDFLFSVMNKIIIKKKFLENIKINCFNFHDGYLPNYAGIYSSTWAILNNEKNHGVTWHLMVNKIDQGKVLIRKKFKIKKDDTAKDVDNNSIVLGFVLFKKLIFNILRNKKIIFFKQDLSKFKYFGYNDRKKIPNYGFINLKSSTASILNLSRALTFSKQKRKKFCELKILTNKGILIIKKIELINQKVSNYQNKNKIIYLKKNSFIVKKNNKYLKIILEKAKMNSFKLINIPKNNLRKYLNYGLTL